MLEFHAEAQLATEREGLGKQGPYVAARAGFEPVTLLTKGVESTNSPPCPMNVIHLNNAIQFRLLNYRQEAFTWGVWLSGRLGALRPEGCRFESHSRHHEWTSAKSFTHSCL